VRAISLASRFLVTLLATCVLPLLVFGWFTLRGVRELIDSQVIATYVPRLAADQARKIDDRLEQILQACSFVREVMRRPLASPGARAAFAEQVELVPDLLDNFLDLLLLVDGEGQVVQKQYGRRLDPNWQELRAARIPASVAGTEWFRRAQQQGGTILLPWGRSDFLNPAARLQSMDPASHHLGLVMDVPLEDGPAGALLALVRWPEVQWVLDETRAVLVREGRFPSAQVFLVGPEGIVYAHTDRSRYGQLLEPAELRAAALATEVGRAAFTDAAGRPHRCGLRRLARGPEWSWTLCLTIPEDELFAATDAFARVLVAAIAVTLVVLVVWSLVASRAIVRPVRDLVAATGRVARGDLAVHVPAGGGPELGGLAASFNQMAAELAAGRERLALAEREKAWAEMARQVAHEIKNPLTPMRMAAQLLQRARREQDPRADEIAERLARTVQQQTEALERIASDFQQFAGAPRRELQDVALDQFLGDVRAAAADLFASGRLRLELHLAAPGASVRIDRRELQRVFVNLLQNAAQAAPAGVTVRIESAVDGARGLVRFADDGPGIPPAAQARLFEPYFTTRTAGTGLGLAICRRIVEAHGGSIRLEAAGPRGTVFRIDLPLLGA
jgi:signal transduction histidine kinase